uniref:Core shell protein Gag P30 domain-containing protein n=1 Tax=Monodelphis domestica TaxID=13616 RepID=A0A5F8HJF3_MONDO
MLTLSQEPQTWAWWFIRESCRVSVTWNDPPLESDGPEEVLGRTVSSLPSGVGPPPRTRRAPRPGPLHPDLAKLSCRHPPPPRLKPYTEAIHGLVASLDNRTKSRGLPEKPNLENPLPPLVLPPLEEPLPDPPLLPPPAASAPLPPPPYTPQLYPPFLLMETRQQQYRDLTYPVLLWIIAPEAERLRCSCLLLIQQKLPPLPPSYWSALLGPWWQRVPLVFQYWPFTSSDLYNWKHQNPPFSEQPQKLIDLVESIFLTHSPTWDDCQQLLHTLFNSEEHDWIIAESKKLVLGDDGGPTTNPAHLATAFPTERPDWNFATDQGRERLQSYCQTLLTGLWAVSRKPTNLAKIDSVR